MLNKGFSMGLPLSNFLQKSNIDLKLAVQLANDIKQEMEELRTNAGKIFKVIFEQVRILSEKFNIEIRIPRLSTRQMHRCNIPISSPEQYYRASIFIPYFDKFITELGERFTNHQVILSGFDSLFKENNHLEDFKNLSDKYTDDFENNGSNNIILEAEYKLWQRLLKQTNKKPHNAMEAITLCNKTIYRTFSNSSKFWQHFQSPRPQTKELSPT